MSELRAVDVPAWLDQTEAPSSGRVHSIFRNTVNLQFDNFMLALQSYGVPATPMSVRLPDGVLERLQFDRSSQVVFRGCSIALGRETIGLSDAVRRDYYLPPAEKSSRAAQEKARNCLRKVLSKAAYRGGFCCAFSDCSDEPDPFSGLEILRTALNRLNCADCGLQESASVVAGLIGLGRGLTPSGDDFTIGFLAALRTFVLHVDSEWRIAFTAAVRKKLDSTVDVSAAFLRYATEFYFSQPLLDLCHACVAGENIEETARRIIGIGYSSGCDMLTGYCAGLDYILTRKTENSYVSL